MMPFATGPQLTYVGLGQYRTVGPTVYVGAHDVISIPSDFTTDLASVPRIFWAWLPPAGPYEYAAVLHDFCCEVLAGRQPLPRPGQPITSRDADGLFRRVMRECGVGPLRRWAMWVGVRWGAAFNPCRRPGWLRDAPAVLALTALGAALLLAAVYGLHALVDLLLPF